MNFLNSHWSTMVLALIICGCQPIEKQSINQRPNILLILVDDMGYGDVSNIGNEHIKTPNLDLMSRTSVNFKNFYVSPVCAPTRASLLTGRYHQEVGVRSVTNGFETMDPDAVTLAEILKKEGYRTGIFGKWHLGEYYPSVPNAQGFDEYLGFRTGHTSNYYDAVLEHNGKPEQTKGYITDMLSVRAMDFMEPQSEQPFFCYLAYNAPHSPLQIDEDKFSRFIEAGLNEKTSRVYGMVENIDENIGKLFDFLEKTGKLNNTIVIFMSDNGPISGWQIPQEKMRFNAGLRDQKFTSYDGGVRTQSYWMWKDHWKPIIDENSVAAHIDVVPTIANLLGIQLSDSLGVDGIDLSPALETHASIDPGRVIFEDFDFNAVRSPGLFTGGMARKGNWKLSKGSELYNLADDPGEKDNLAEKHPDILKELKAKYESYYTTSYSDSLFFPKPIRVGYFEENPVHIKSHHGKVSGNVRMTGFRGNYGEKVGYHPSGVDGDWTSNWKETGDKLEWSVEFIEESQYEIGMTANGNVGENSCFFNIEVNGNSTKASMPQMQNVEDWQYIPMLKINTSGIANIGFNLHMISESDSLNINELVILRMDD